MILWLSIYVRSYFVVNLQAENEEQARAKLVAEDFDWIADTEEVAHYPLDSIEDMEPEFEDATITEIRPIDPNQKELF